MLLKAKNIFFKLSINTTPILLVCAMDWYTKNQIIHLNGSRNWGPLHFEIVYNSGMILGISTQLPLSLKIITLTTLAAIIVGSYIMIITIVPMRSLLLRLGLPTLLAGIICNVIDRVIHNAVIDIVSIRLLYYSTPFLNVADICQWFGYAFIFLGLYQDSRYYWPINDLRNKFFINKQFQIRIGIVTTLISLVTGFVLLIFGIIFIQVSQTHENIEIYLLYGSALIAFLSAANFVIGVILSHRIAGPIYVLNRYIDDTLQRKKYPLKFREHDEFKELESSLTKLNTEMQRLYEIETPPPLPVDAILDIEKKSRVKKH